MQKHYFDRRNSMLNCSGSIGPDFVVRMRSHEDHVEKRTYILLQN
jgi:hypothetical protein